MNCANCGRPKEEHLAVQGLPGVLPSSVLFICPRNVFVPEK